MSRRYHGSSRMLAAAVAAICLSGPLNAAEQVARDISIPAGELSSALNQFAREYGIEILYRADQTKGVPTSGVRGRLPVQEAVRQLLIGTPFVVKSDSSGAMVVTLQRDSVQASGRTQATPIRLAQATPTPQTTASAQPEPPRETLEEVVVVGSHIKGTELTGILPITIVDRTDIAATAAVSGDELFRSIPQVGAVAFNESRTTGGINDARGDVASINLRALGTGNTLVLLNGRRLVLHPGTQAENLVPVTSVNTNSIPVMGIQRMEVLRDGASAIYGTDAVAGVINTVLRRDFEGFSGEVQYGGSEGTDLREMTAVGQFGMDFNEGRTNLSVFASYYDRDGMMASEREYSASSDLRPLVAGTPFADDTDFDNRSTSTPWGVFRADGFGRVTRNGTAITSTAGQFHIQPDTNEGCRVALGGGTCIDDAGFSGTTDRNLRYDVNAPRSVTSDGERANAFAFFNHEFDGGLEFFSELSYYDARTVGYREQASPLSSARITVPASNYYNPFGATTLPNGSPNPNRLSGLNVPAAGIPLTITNYRPIDTPARRIVVNDDSYRVLGGLRYSLDAWDLETAALYSEAQTVDRTFNRISNTLFQQALALATPDAYNPFNGGDLQDLSRNDSTLSSAATIDSFLIDVYRDSETSLALWDARASNERLFGMPAGDVGIAVGVEWRLESFRDDRDPRLDGTSTYTDMVTGEISGSDVMGSSPTPDTSGHRHVLSGYVEFGVPLVSPDMSIPLVRSFDLQLAGRYEDYSDVGDVVKPKVAFAWAMSDWVQLRGAWSEGFRAPNLPQVFEVGVERVNTRTDYIQCEADLRAGRIANFDDCTSSQQVASSRSGSRELEPEDVESYSLGLVFTPTVIPRLTLAVDYWRIEQDGIVGIFGDNNQIALDYLLRTQGGSNPNVIRAAPDQDDIDAFAGTGLTPAGEIVQVIDNYTNLLPRTVEGLDLSLLYSTPDTAIGRFTFGLNAARLLEFYQEPSERAAAILAAQGAGAISDTFTVGGAEDLMEREGRPRWRGTASVNWRYGGWGAGLFGSYVGRVFDENATLADGTPFEIEDWLTVNVYGQYEFDAGWLDETVLRLGVRNVSDEDPPLADESFGYLGDLHSNRGRYWYASVRRRF